jgi:LuxR family maltose regulon positive regulatory protein
MDVCVPSKLAPPALLRDLVSRPTLRAALDAGAQRALTLVCAPPGFGKTLLLADWVKRSPDIPTAWVSLDEEDVDPRRLWSGVLAALRACPSVPRSSRLHRLLVSRTTVELDFLDDLLQALAELPQPVRLVLDDVHHLRHGPVVEHLRILVRDHAPQLRLILASRMDPFLPLARMRLNDELSELRVDRMRFSVAESLALLERNGLGLERRQCVDLHERTGGWVAGLRLAMRSLSGSTDADSFLDAFSGDERSVADYLTGEVLAEISDQQREVLRRTSIADPIPPGLAVELCEREDAADVLDALVHELGLVTVSDVDHGEYRVQELLRSYLVADLRRRGDDQAVLHRRAARWWDRQGRPAKALRHACRTGDREFIADLVRRRTPELVAKGEHDVLLDLMAVSDGDHEMEAWRAVLSAQAHLLSGDRAAVCGQVRRARESGGVEPGSGLALLLTAIEQLAGVAACPPRVVALPEDLALAALVLAGRGAGRVASGALVDGRADLTAALDAARRLDLPLLEAQCLTILSVACLICGDLPNAASLADAASAALCGGGWDTTGWAAAARAAGSLAALDRAEPEIALATADTGLRAATPHLDPVIRFALRTVRGGALFDCGESVAGLLELQQARDEVGQVPVPLLLAARAALLEHRIALRLGYARAAAGAAGWLGGFAGAHSEQLLMRAWAESAAGPLRSDRMLLARLLQEQWEQAVWSGGVVETWLVASRSALEDGDRPAARHALRSALDRAMPLDLVRPFGLAAAEVRALLVDELVGRDARSRLAARALAAGRTGGRLNGGVLTAREHEVLARLPTLLNLDEIADDLSVSINTVKSHIRSIYDKLGAGTRRTAVLAAHEQGILC